MAINLDQARAARREAKKEAPTVILGKQKFVMPVEMPFAITESLGSLKEAQENDDNAKLASSVLDIIRVLFGTQYEDFMKHQPSMADLEVMLDGLMSEYGLSDKSEDASE